MHRVLAFRVLAFRTLAPCALAALLGGALPARAQDAAANAPDTAGGPGRAAELKVKITPELAEVRVRHNGAWVTVRRNQDPQNQVNEAFALTSRECPPFCIQPYTLAPGVDTVAELEVLDYLRRMSAGDDSILVIDSRTPDWAERGTIPGAVNIPWTQLERSHTEALIVEDVVENQFGAKRAEGFWDFDQAKTLVLFCNGVWCGQSPTNIRSLLRIGYPAHKLKWYRGGMQSWEMLGLTTVKP